MTSAGFVIMFDLSGTAIPSTNGTTENLLTLERTGGSDDVCIDPSSLDVSNIFGETNYCASVDEDNCLLINVPNSCDDLDCDGVCDFEDEDIDGDGISNATDCDVFNALAFEYDCQGICGGNAIDSDNNGVCDNNEVSGCTDATDCAYDSSATVHDDSMCSGVSACACEECSSTTTSSVGSCSDVVGWVDSYGYGCSEYASYGQVYCGSAAADPWANLYGLTAQDAAVIVMAVEYCQVDNYNHMVCS